MSSNVPATTCGVPHLRNSCTAVRWRGTPKFPNTVRFPRCAHLKHLLLRQSNLAPHGQHTALPGALTMSPQRFVAFTVRPWFSIGTMFRFRNNYFVEDLESLIFDFFPKHVIGERARFIRYARTDIFEPVVHQFQEITGWRRTFFYLLQWINLIRT